MNNQQKEPKMNNQQEEPKGGLSQEEKEERRIAEEERRKELQKWLKVGGWTFASGAGLLALLALGGPFAAFLGICALAFFIIAEIAAARRQKYCEVEIIRSRCNQGWLKTGQHLCIACPKEGKCLEGTQEIDVWDLPLEAPEAKETDPKCRIEIRHLTKECKYKCEHPTLVYLPVKKD